MYNKLKKTRMKKLILTLIVFSVLFISACTPEGSLNLEKVSEADVDKVIRCEKPYIRHASACCLDQNDNKICDKDELENKEQKENYDVFEDPNVESIEVKYKEIKDAFLGNENAPITLTIYSDFQAPFYRKWYDDTFPMIKSEYVDKGKVKLGFQHFPLTSIHPMALKSAEASECAREQGKFWEIHNKMLDEQNKFGQGTVPFTNDDLKKWASEIGLDSNKFDSCLDSGKYGATIRQQFEAGNILGVSGTPTFFVTNLKGDLKIVGGAQPYEVFEQAINKLL